MKMVWVRPIKWIAAEFACSRVVFVCPRMPLVLWLAGTGTRWFSGHGARLVTRRGDAKHGMPHRQEKCRGLLGSQTSAAVVQDRLNGADRPMDHRPEFDLVDRGPQLRRGAPTLLDSAAVSGAIGSDADPASCALRGNTPSPTRVDPLPRRLGRTPAWLTPPPRRAIALRSQWHASGGCPPLSKSAARRSLLLLKWR